MKDMMLIEVQVKTNKSQNQITQTAENVYSVELMSQPHENAANKELINVISKYFKCSKSQVTIRSGQKSKDKLLTIDI